MFTLLQRLTHQRLPQRCRPTRGRVRPTLEILEARITPSHGHGGGGGGGSPPPPPPPPYSFDWALNAPSQGNDVATDSAGNSYVGTASGSLAKYDPTGTNLWVQPTTGGDIRSIAVDANNNVYVAGDFGRVAEFGDSANPTILTFAALATIPANLQDGDTITFTDTANQTRTLEFVYNNRSADGNDIPISFTGTETQSEMNARITSAINGADTQVAANVVDSQLINNVGPSNVWLEGLGFNNGAIDLSVNTAGVLANQSVFRNFVAKYASDGTFLWAEQMGGSDDPIRLTAGGGNVYAAGQYAPSSVNAIDLDPDPKMVVQPPNANGVYVVKLNSDGQRVWDAAPDGPAANGGLVSLGIAYHNAAVYVTGELGTNLPFVWKETDSGAVGNEAWVQVAEGTGGGAGIGITVDSNGNVWVTGSYGGTVDFDPSGGTFDLTSTTGTFYYPWSNKPQHYSTGDVFVWELDNAGNFLQALGIGGTGYDSGTAITSDGQNVYVSGGFTGQVDFDPGKGTFYLGTDDATERGFVLKLDTTAANFVWAAELGSGGAGNTPDPSTGDSFAADTGGVALDSSGNVYATGWFLGSQDFDPTGGTDILSTGSTDIENMFLVKLGQPSGSTLTAAVASNQLSTQTLSVAPTQPLFDESVNPSTTAGTGLSALSGLSWQIANLLGNTPWPLGPDHQADSLMALTQNAGTARLPSSNAGLVNVAALDQVFSDSGPLLFGEGPGTGTNRNHA